MLEFLPYCKQTLTCKILQSAKFTNVQKAFFSDLYCNINLYLKMQGYRFMKEDICLFQTNLRVQDHNKLFDKLLKEDLQKWYAHW